MRDERTGHIEYPVVSPHHAKIVDVRGRPNEDGSVTTDNGMTWRLGR